MNNDWKTLTDKMQEGSVLAMSRLITKVENREPGWLDAMQLIYGKIKRTPVIGLTGSPGAGKSTLTNEMTRVLYNMGLSVGIVAIDPSSPFTGGALLGDRLRMTDISTLENVFLRSMATRGAMGGLSVAARDVIKIIDAFGKDIILIETVGVGQDEVEVMRAADLVVVVCVPGQGDGIQAIKAGIMEIADIFVVNKADKDGSDQLVMELESMQMLIPDKAYKEVPVLKTISTTGKGVEKFVETLFVKLKEIRQEKSRQKNRIREELVELVEKEIERFLINKWDKDGSLEKGVNKIVAGEENPYSIAQDMISSIIKYRPSHK